MLSRRELLQIAAATAAIVPNASPLAFARWRKRFERAALAWATVWLAGWGVLIWSLAGVGTSGLSRAIIVRCGSTSTPFLRSHDSSHPSSRHSRMRFGRMQCRLYADHS